MSIPACSREKETRLACPCPKTGCVNHGRCCVCIENHRLNGKPVYCMAVLVGKK